MLLRVEHCDGTSIHVAGFIFDEILDVSHFSDKTRQPYTAYVAVFWVRLAQLHLGARGMSRLKYGTYTRALIRTFGSNRHVKDLALADLDSPTLVQREDGPLDVLSAIHARSDTMVAAGHCGDKIVGFSEAIRRNFHLAKFFVTKNLHIGLTPLDASVGDRIAILASGNVPFVLRPVSEDYAGEEAYRIMGGCYVDGTVIQRAKMTYYMLTSPDRFDARGSRILRSCTSLQGR
jgi:hypothetical protein